MHPPTSKRNFYGGEVARSWLLLSSMVPYCQKLARHSNPDTRPYNINLHRGTKQVNDGHFTDRIVLAAACFTGRPLPPPELAPTQIPAGIVVWPMIYALQDSTHNWKDPHTFKPVRGK